MIASACRHRLRPETIKGKKSMLVRLPFLLILSVIAAGCVSGTSDRQLPNYVEAELADNPIPRGSMVAPDLPDEIGGPQ